MLKTENIQILSQGSRVSSWTAAQEVERRTKDWTEEIRQKIGRKANVLDQRGKESCLKTFFYS